MKTIQNAATLLDGVLRLADDVAHLLVFEEVGGATRLEDGSLEGERGAVELRLEGILPRIAQGHLCVAPHNSVSTQPELDPEPGSGN